MSVHPILHDHKPLAELRKRREKLRTERDAEIKKAETAGEWFYKMLAALKPGEAIPPTPLSVGDVRRRFHVEDQRLREQEDQVLADDGEHLQEALERRGNDLLREIREHVAAIEEAAGEFKQALGAHIVAGRAMGHAGRVVNGENTGFDVLVECAREGLNPMVDTPPVVERHVGQSLAARRPVSLAV